MRVIRTELYFAPDSVSGRDYSSGQISEDMPADISVAWLPRGTDVNELDQRLQADLAYRSGRITDHGLREFFEAVLRGYEDASSSRGTYNGALIDEILVEPIVIERSPPETVPLGDLLKGALSPIQMGVYIGVISAMPVNSLLMLVTVPAGIILVGTAVTVTNAIMRRWQDSTRGDFNPSPPFTIPPNTPQSPSHIH